MMRILVSAIALLLLSAPASAQTWEMSGTAGRTQATSIDKQAPELSGLEVRDGFTFGIQAARFFTPHWGTEVLWTEQASALRLETDAGSADSFLHVDSATAWQRGLPVRRCRFTAAPVCVRRPWRHVLERRQPSVRDQAVVRAWRWRQILPLADRRLSGTPPLQPDATERRRGRPVLRSVWLLPGHAAAVRDCHRRGDPRSGALPWPEPWTCMSTNPGITYMPLPLISWSKSRGSRLGVSAMPGQPAWRTAVMRLPSTTMSIGLRGGPPVPSIRVTPRITIFERAEAFAGLRAGAGVSPPARRLGLRSGRGRLGERGLTVTDSQGQRRQSGGGIDCCLLVHRIPRVKFHWSTGLKSRLVLKRPIIRLKPPARASNRQQAICLFN